MNVPLSNNDLVRRAAGGDRAAFAALVGEHYDFMFRTAYKWCGNRADAEDVAQDVCVRLARALGSFDGRSAFTSWLYRVVLNAVRDRQRQGARRAKQADALREVSASDVAPDQESAVAERQLWDAVRQLPEKQRDAMLLVYAEERSHAETAQIMGVKESTVSWYVHEAKKALKDMV
ncbi:RNA polymerase sigma factor [Pelagibacterium sediminicola]|uniref:RNA polymerase sigma factor n=1 Tax=Pelagibacterium sediminicola TaxID=2248761 RepID=UPI000E30E03D|nr:RNA polymerase sigma factor [Pelagibacterium sediminicola]